jgi:glycine/D-amino acid oxidase-like deaminating enzyme
MSAKPHPWGTAPWTVRFRPIRRPIPASVDFVVVGGGFSGLSAAAWLRRLAPEESVILLERSVLGDGASGRTGGMALAETAAGHLSALGDVLAGYRRILRTLKVDAELSLPGAWELARRGGSGRSPIHWSDSGDLRVAAKVPGGTVNPGRVVAGLARAAQSAGAQIVEHAEVVALDHAPPRSGRDEREMQLKVRVFQRGKTTSKLIRARRVLLATNGMALDLAGLGAVAQPKLTLAIATAPLARRFMRSASLSADRSIPSTYRICGAAL